MASPDADLRRLEPRGGRRPVRRRRAARRAIVIDHLQRSIIYDRTSKSWDAARRRCASASGGTRRCDDVSVDELRVYDRQLSRLEAQALAGVADPLGDVLRTPAASRTAAQQAALREHYLLRDDPAFAAPLAAS